MKRIFLLLCFGIICSIAVYAPERKTLTIEIKPPIKPYEAITNAVAMVESNMDDNAYNRIEKATGRYQVRPIRLKDYNKRTGSHLKLKEMYNPLKAEKVFLYYAMQIGYQDPEKIIRCWNGGERGMKKKSTKEYYKKVRKVLEMSK
jgi:hypothetical protein